jgi:hypothetical protein
MDPHVKSVRALDDYGLEVTFDNGECRRFDVKPYLERGIFVRLRDRSLFQAVRAVAGSIEWQGGVDLSYETLYVEGQPVIMSHDELDALNEPVVGLDPRTWYRFVQLQIDLLRNHVQEVEEQIQASVQHYHKESVATDVDRDDEGHRYVILQEHRGMEGPPHHLDEIFEYYLPNLHRRGALVMLFSFLEHELNRLCELFAEQQSLEVVYTDLKGSPVDRSRRYLKKVICLAIDDNSRSWQEIRSIQKVRNVIVHNDARLVEKDAIKCVREAVHLSTASESSLFPREIDKVNIDEVNILEGYLTYVLDTIDRYCSELNTAIGALFAS